MNGAKIYCQLTSCATSLLSVANVFLAEQVRSATCQLYLDYVINRFYLYYVYR